MLGKYWPSNPVPVPTLLTLKMKSVLTLCVPSLTCKGHEEIALHRGCAADDAAGPDPARRPQAARSRNTSATHRRWFALTGMFSALPTVTLRVPGFTSTGAPVLLTERMAATRGSPLRVAGEQHPLPGDQEARVAWKS